MGVFCWSLVFHFVLISRSSAKNVDTHSEGYQQRLENSKTLQSSDIQVRFVPGWPNKNIKYGQVSGVALDVDGNVYVFHRGTRIWDEHTFDDHNVFISSKKPIPEPTVAVIHPSTGNLLHEWGREMFYLPHGITVDRNANVWVTDVGMHQVFKFPPILNPTSANYSNSPTLTVGQKLQPGSEKYTFCKPTAVAVQSSGEFFVADGYCNARIVKYNASGSFLMQWGHTSLSTGPAVRPPHFYIPHDLTLAEDKNLLYVSDRENGRIQCFSASNGSFAYQIQSREIGSRIFSASYTPALGGLLFIVNGPEDMTGYAYGSVTTANADFKRLATFRPRMKMYPFFLHPHDLIVSPDCTSLYVAELCPSRVWKFDIDGEASGTMLMEMAILSITVLVLCFGAVLLAIALVYSRAK